MARLLPLLAGMTLLSSGCSDLLDALRPDADDSPKTARPLSGGLWSERGFLSDTPPERGDRQEGRAGSGRGPASDGGGSGGGDPWVSADRDAANRRDAVRGEIGDGDGENQVSYGNTPDLPPSTRRMYKNGGRATRDDFIDQSQNEGSLWAPDGQTNYYFTKNKVHSVGDIVTVKIGSGLIRDIGLEVKRTLNENERDAELALAEDRARARAEAQGSGKDAVSSSQAAPAQGPAGGAAGSQGSIFSPAPGGPSVEVRPSDIDVSKSLELKPGDLMMAEIVERYPNGNYRIRGSKRVIYRNGAPRLVSLTGVVRASDIGNDDVIDSGKLYEYRLDATRR